MSRTGGVQGATPRDAGLTALLALALSPWLALLLLAALGDPAHDESLEWRVFVLGWPVLTLVSALLAWALRIRATPARLGPLALGASLIAALGAGALRAGTLSGWPTPLALLPLVACAGLAEASRRTRLAALSEPRAAAACLLLLASAGALLALDPLPSGVAGLALLASGLGVGAAWVFAQGPLRVLPGVWADAAVGVALIALLFDPHLHTLPGHAAWYLGPANHVLQGGVPWVDAFSSYGVGPVLTLAGFFALTPFDPSYPAFTALCQGLVILQYALLYGLLRGFGLPPAHGALALAAMLLAHFVGTRGTLALYPSLGPLRYGLPLLLPLWTWLGAVRPERAGAARAAEIATLGVAALWSVETFAFTVATWIGMLAVETADAMLRGRPWLVDTVRRLAAGVAAGVAAHLLFAAAVWLRAGALPQWGFYFDLVSAHAPGGGEIGLGLVPRFGGWLAFVGALAASLFACAAAVLTRPEARERAILACVAGMTLLGVAQLGIYLGKSVDYRLHAAALPVVFVLAFWLDRATRSRDRTLAIAAVAVAVSGTALTYQTLRPRFVEWWKHDSASWLSSDRFLDSTYGCSELWTCLREPPVAHDATPSLERLVERFSPEGAPLALFLDDIATTEALLRLGRRHTYPLSSPFQDGLVQSSFDRVRNASTRLREGDVVFLQNGLLGSKHPTAQLTRTLAFDLCERFVCNDAGRDGSVIALRLGRKPGPK